jgi:mannose-6-phosphate isomerase-like protein (cupin superfamily)
VPLFAAYPQGLTVWKASDLKSFDKSPSLKLDSHKAAMEELSKVGDYQSLIVHREGDGEVEVHKDALLLIFVSGEATLSAGGERKTVAEGDVVLIPANLPHQVLVAAGKRVTYLVIRQERDEATSSGMPAASSLGPSGKKPVLGIDLGSGFRACVPGDDSPEDTVVDGYRKVISQSFLGASCIWKPEPSTQTLKTGTAGNNERSRPGADVGQGYRSCIPGDDSPSGTIVDGYRKVSSSSPFGVSCGWEKIK